MHAHMCSYTPLLMSTAAIYISMHIYTCTCIYCFGGLGESYILDPTLGMLCLYYLIMSELSLFDPIILLAALLFVYCFLQEQPFSELFSNFVTAQELFIYYTHTLRTARVIEDHCKVNLYFSQTSVILLHHYMTASVSIVFHTVGDLPMVAFHSQGFLYLPLMHCHYSPRAPSNLGALFIAQYVNFHQKKLFLEKCV